jgi:molybdopterin-guanine dinucleotide biosynthesis protein A
MITTAIQAGGSSSRMGHDKAFVELNGRPLIEHVIRRIANLGDETLIVTNQLRAYSHLGLRTVPDAVSGTGALVGLYSALCAAQGDTVLVVACDMPFLNRALLEHQLRLAPQADAVVPRHQSQYEPLHAVYDRRMCLPAIEESLQAGEERLVSFYPNVRVLTVDEVVLDRLDPGGLSFFNVNTPQDLARAEQLIADGAVRLD